MLWLYSLSVISAISCGVVTASPIGKDDSLAAPSRDFVTSSSYYRASVRPKWLEEYKTPLGPSAVAHGSLGRNSHCSRKLSSRDISWPFFCNESGRAATILAKIELADLDMIDPYAALDPKPYQTNLKECTDSDLEEDSPNLSSDEEEHLVFHLKLVKLSKIDPKLGYMPQVGQCNLKAKYAIEARKREHARRRSTWSRRRGSILSLNDARSRVLDAE